MECKYCLSTEDITWGLTTAEGHHYFCDRACGYAYAREDSKDDIINNIGASKDAIRSSNKALLELGKDIPEEERLEKGLFLREFIRYSFASKLFYQAMFNRETLETITRLKDLHIEALKHIMDIMFCSDLIKESYPNKYYHTGRLLSPQSINSYNLLSKAWSK
jgi:hypothetical protein